MILPGRRAQVPPAPIRLKARGGRRQRRLSGATGRGGGSARSLRARRLWRRHPRAASSRAVREGGAPGGLRRLPRALRVRQRPRPGRRVAKDDFPRPGVWSALQFRRTSLAVPERPARRRGGGRRSGPDPGLGQAGGAFRSPPPGRPRAPLQDRRQHLRGRGVELRARPAARLASEPPRPSGATFAAAPTQGGAERDALDPARAEARLRGLRVALAGAARGRSPEAPRWSTAPPRQPPRAPW